MMLVKDLKNYFYGQFSVVFIQSLLKVIWYNILCGCNNAIHIYETHVPHFHT